MPAARHADDIYRATKSASVASAASRPLSAASADVAGSAGFALGSMRLILSYGYGHTIYRLAIYAR